MQNHYDFGMRTLKACLTRAGELIRLMSLSEDLLILKVLQEVNMPKFTEGDLPLYQSIILDLFPKMELPENPQTMALRAKLIQKCEEQGWQPKEVRL